MQNSLFTLDEYKKEIGLVYMEDDIYYIHKITYSTFILSFINSISTEDFLEELVKRTERKELVGARLIYLLEVVHKRKGKELITPTVIDQMIKIISKVEL